MSKNFNKAARNYDNQGFRLVSKKIDGQVDMGTAVRASGIFDMAYNCETKTYTDYGIGVIRYDREPEIIYFISLTSEEILEIYQNEFFLFSNLDMNQGTEINTQVGKMLFTVRSFNSKEETLSSLPIVLNYNTPKFKIDFSYPILIDDQISQKNESIVFYSCIQLSGDKRKKEFNYNDLFTILREHLKTGR